MLLTLPGQTGPVVGVAYKDCNWQVPYKVSYIHTLIVVLLIL
jgi:hypothetical protein